MKRLKNKYILITGGSSGIGLETAKLCVEEGATVAITGRDSIRLQTAEDYIGSPVLKIISDASCVEAQYELSAILKETWGVLNAVYINAADVTHLPITSWTKDLYNRVMDTNLQGPFFLIQSLLPLLQPSSSIVLCSSVSAHIGLAQSSVYAASKAALLSLAKTLSSELLSSDIRVNVITPGPTQTPAIQKLGLPEAELLEMIDKIKTLVPLQRMGTPEEIAKGVIFLLSDESSYMRGAELLMDGGVKNL